MEYIITNKDLFLKQKQRITLIIKEKVRPEDINVHIKIVLKISPEKQDKNHTYSSIMVLNLIGVHIKGALSNFQKDLILEFISEYTQMRNPLAAQYV